ncbi:Stk1 family PASTA domain-containing Ser/Thr kinase [Microbacterium horticulturae]|uniref:non-specific serine/threonine protein kinase n=1 Tax=Microbacterium horticulturae TaxID=3028316 RepID=A0ABY8C130_9MICO|nr:Stk1 family PASTA domain-containing Ser/Thr kinase [Microbacterium sp. KACC 23027]WEG10149.1 Stk1 family PASTA domain-containing Ser/Thr kinase [Microbacterium sp. KACC 23027]
MTTSAQADPLIGRLVDGRYRVRARIARGGMATVYVATDLRLERRVALKVMHSHLSDDAVFQSRFIQEARAAARLADPHVVNVFDQGQEGEMAYLVMEYLPGITLRELLREQKRLTLAQAVTIMDAVLSGLSAAHRANIVHRDVKPENVLLAEDGRIKIGDFGLARATTANTGSGQMLLGTIAYLAPELVTRGTADARSDIYALGIMLYEMLTGEQPYKGEQPMQIAFQHATESVPRPSVRNPGVPEPLDELVLWSTEKSPDDRPTDAGVMLARLREIEQQLGIAPQVQRTLAVAGVAASDHLDTGELTKVLPPSVEVDTPVEGDDNSTRLRHQAGRRRAKGWWLFAIVIVLAVVAAGIGLWFGSGPGSQVIVPTVAGKTFAQAKASLAEQQLGAKKAGQNSLDVAAGRVISTDPGPGTRLDKDATVTVTVSLGPAEATIDTLEGMPEKDARATFGAQHITVAEKSKTFYTDDDEGTVIGAVVHPADGGKDVDCAKGCTVHQGDSATLSVSLGALPSVIGMSLDDAVAKLEDKGITVTAHSEQYSDSAAKGTVISMADRDGGGSWRPGDKTTLVISKGPQLFEVPDVTGQTRDEAKQTLSQAGFRATYNGLWDAVINGVTKVTSQSPVDGSTCNGDGTLCASGTTIELKISGSF